MTSKHINALADKLPFTGMHVINWGMGLLFIWGGLEKFFEGFLGGVGLTNMANFLGQIGFDFLGGGILFALAIVIAVIELVAGVLLIINKKTQEAAAILAVIILVAFGLAHVPSGNWMNIMIHLALLTTLIGMALTRQK